MTPETLARRFHEAYERLAPSFGYETRKESAVAWEDVPERNKALMVAVAAEMLRPEPDGDGASLWTARDHYGQVWYRLTF